LYLKISLSRWKGHAHRDSIEDQLFDIIELEHHAGDFGSPAANPLKSYLATVLVDVVLRQSPALQVREQKLSSRIRRTQLAYERHKVTQEELAQHFAVTGANLERAKREVDATGGGGSVKTGRAGR
jgi:hypothetical protein